MPEVAAGRPLPGAAFQYRATGSPLHRLGAGWKAALGFLAGAGALACDGWLGLTGLLFASVAGYRLARLSAGELWQDTRWLLLQGGLVIALSLARFGAEGFVPGARAAAQIALFFLPGALLLRTTPTLELVASLQGLLPPRLAFAAGASLRFVPFFARELSDIIGAQRLRGARLAARELWRPGAWRDWIECVGVPMVVRAIHTANEAALAAEIRGIGAEEERA